MAQESFEQLLNAVKQAESQGKRFDEKGNLLTSLKGAQGEMQVMPKTALKPGYGVAPAQNKSPDELARVGKDYLAAMLGKYGDREKALIAYNWGPKNTDDWLASGADPKKLPAETQNYVQKINGMLSGTKSTATAPSEPTNSEKMMTDALKSGMSAKNLVQEAGPGYKAAMAMMFLADDKPETTEDDIWKEAEPEVVAEEEAPSPLASLDLTYKSPFPAQNPVPVQRLASGGMPFTPTIGVKGTAREELDKIKADYDVYNTEVGKYNDIQNAYKAQVDAYNAAANAYNDSFYKNNGNMLVAQYVAPQLIRRGVYGPSSYNYFTANDKGELTAYKPTEDFSKAIYQAIPESPGYSLLRLSNVAAPGTAPTAPTAVAPTAPAVTQEQYQAKADAAKMDAKQRQMAVNIASDPESYGLTINRLFNQGGVVHRADGTPESGEVKEPWLPSVSNYAAHTAYQMYPEQQGQFDQQDAARHMLAAGTLARKYGPTAAELLGKAHEITTSPFSYIGSKLGLTQMPVDYEQDLHNNKVGIELAARSKSQKDLENLVMQMAEQHRLQQTAGKPWTGKPVHRADGTPETGEIGPAFGNPNIQRQGAKARALAAKRDVNTLPDPKTYAAVSGFLGTPYEEQGWSVLHPNRQGIQNAADTGYLTGLGTQILPVAAPVVKGAAKMVGSALNERMLSGQSLTPGFNTPAPINFAIKEPGGYFVHNRYEGLDDVDSFLKNFAGVTKSDDSPLKQWMYKRYGNYMRGQMGTEMDPFVKGADAGKRFHFMDEQGQVHRPHYASHAPYMREQAGLPKGGFAKTQVGSELETAIDTSISPVAVEDVSDRSLTEGMRKLREKDPTAPVYEVLYEEMDDVLKPTEMRQSLSTMLRDKSLPPEYQLTEDQLKKMSLTDASEKVAQFDKYITQRDNDIRMKAADSIPVYKQYDDGSKWLAPEDTVENAASKDYVMLTGKHAGWCTDRESNCFSYGSGDSRLFILADKTGKPLVQINQEEHVPGIDVWLKYGMDADRAKMLKDDYMWHQLEQMPEYQQWAKSNSATVIGEIKGRNNNTNLTGDEREKARDFVRSRTWDSVGEIDNIGLTDLRDEVYKAGRATDLGLIENEARRKFGTIYLTDDELNQIKPLLNAPEESSGSTPFKTGGMVERNTGDNRRYL